MIKAILKFSTIMVLMAGVFFPSCQSSAEKSDAADAKVIDAKQDLKDAQQDAVVAAQKAATAEELAAFKTDSELRIIEIDKQIAVLKQKMRVAGKKVDASYEESIKALEQKNKDMKNRMDTYNNNAQSDWESFKREFNHDMDELGNAMKDLTVNNKK